MSQKSIILIVVLFVLIVVGMFTFAHLKKSEIQPVPKVETPPKEEVVPYPDITRVDAKHYFIDGVHTLVGEIDFPTPCDLLNAEATVTGSSSKQAVVDFSVINNAESCTQVITAQRFKVSFEATEDATITARFMGRDITLNLIPAAPGEVPEDFELFIKG